MNPVVRTKVVLPSKPSTLLHRPRLVDFIHEHIDRNLILISAAAGYGKTSLLLDFAYDTDLPVCWYSLDPSDVDVRTFLEHLTASIAQRFPQIDQGPLGNLLQGEMEAPDPQGLLTLLVNEVQDTVAEYFVLMLDDYHLVDPSDDVKLTLEWLLDHLPDNCCLLISSRIMPRLPLLKLAARRQVAGLGNDDLRFNAEEIRELLAANYKIFIPEEEAERLAVVAEGWITAILLSTHTLWKGLLQTIVRAQGSGKQLYAYLAEEVFDQQPPEFQEFLKASSILAVMDADLCNEVLCVENSAEMLDMIEGRNLFVSKLEEETTCYRYHHLFREFLFSRFVPSEQVKLRELHYRAGQALKRRGDLNETVRHYLAAEDYRDVSRVIETSAEAMFNAGKLHTLAEWIDSLPPVERSAHPNVQLMRGRIHQEKSDIAQAERAFADVYQQFVQADDLKGQAKALVQLASTHRLQGRFEEAIEKSKQVLALASLGELDRRTVAEAHRTHGLCLAYVGNLQEAEAELSKSLSLYEQTGDKANVANLYQGMGMVAHRGGRLSEGEQWYRRALTIWEQLQNSNRIAEMLNSVAMTHHYRGEYARALELLENALTRAREGQHARIEGTVLASLGDVYADLDQYELAIKMYSNALDIARQGKRGFLTLYSLTRLAEIQSLDHRWREAKANLDEGAKVVQVLGGAYNRGLLKLSWGIYHCLVGKPELAVNNLRSACNHLRRVGADRELARAHLHLAYGLYLAKRWEEATVSLRKSLILSAQMGYDQFLVADGKRMVPLLRRALDEHVATGELRPVLERIERLPRLVRRRRRPKARAIRPYLEIFAFGRGRVVAEGKRVDEAAWEGSLAKGLFFYIVERGPKTKEQVGVIFWPDYSPAKMSSSFHAAMYRVRRAVPADFIVYDTDSQTYRVDQTYNYFYDVERFGRLLNEARRESWSDRLDAQKLYEEALLLYQGHYLENCYFDWCVETRVRLSQEHVQALLALGELNEQEGSHQESIALYKKAVQQDPFREEIHRRIMRCYISLSERPAAIQHYIAYANLLKAEMGINPGEELRALYEQTVTESKEE